MKRFILLALLVMVVTMVFAIPASADNLGPCNDANGDESASGREYAEHHIAFLAKKGKLGSNNDNANENGKGHSPGGGHQGFSLCLDQAQSGG